MHDYEITRFFMFIYRSALVGNQNVKDNASIGKSLGFVLSTKSTETLLTNNRNNRTKSKIVDAFMIEVRKILDNTIVQGACDFAGISRDAYVTIFKMMKEALTSVSITKFPIPRPFQIKGERDALNRGMQKIIGVPFHIEEIYQSKDKSMSYNKSNNMFIDMNMLLRFIVHFYDISTEKVDSKIVLVLKLDESELIKGQKMERVSITLMNGALQKTNDQRDFNFSVQSENDIWWLAAFEV